MDIIAIVAQKGGTGKTTLAVSLAVAGERDGCAGAIVDLDPQASASNWGDRREADSPVVRLGSTGASWVRSPCG